MINLTGDIHGNMERLSKAADKLNADDILIPCGDVGFALEQDPVIQLEKLRLVKGNIVFVDGNHENFDWLNRQPVEEWNGGRVHVLAPNVRHLMRGEVFTIEGKTVFAFGGAYSIDRARRQQGVSWWPEELPSMAERNNAMSNLAKVDHIDAIVTHTAPRILLHMLRYTVDPHENELQLLLTTIYRSVPFTRWYFGHLHENFERGRFTALYDDVVCMQ